MRRRKHVDRGKIERNETVCSVTNENEKLKERTKIFPPKKKFTQSERTLSYSPGTGHYINL